MLTTSTSEPYHRLLISTQEEADTKVTAHAVDFLEKSDQHNVTIWGYRYHHFIVVHIVFNNKSVAIDIGSGKNRKSILLESILLIKGKDMCWKFLGKKFEECFSHLGQEQPLSIDLFSVMQEYVCLYGKR